MLDEKRQVYETYPQTYMNILKLIHEYAAMGEKLPPEEVLASKLGVSRVKVRDSLAALENEGYISRRRGIGTFINTHILRETARLDIHNTYEETLTKSGLTPRIDLQKIKLLAEPPEHVVKGLELGTGEGVYLVRKAVYANDVPAIDVYDDVPEKYFDTQEIDLPLLNKCTFYCVQSLCDELLESLIIHLDACEAGEEVAKNLGIAPTAPVLQLQTICYSQSFLPIMYYEEYLNTKVIPFSFQKRMMRNKYRLS